MDPKQLELLKKLVTGPKTRLSADEYASAGALMEQGYATMSHGFAFLTGKGVGYCIALGLLET